MNPAILAMLITQLIWGLAPVYVRDLSTTIGAADSIIARYTIVSLAYIPLLYTSKRRVIARKDWPRLCLASLIGISGYNIFSSFGFEYVSAGLGGLIIGTQPMIIALMGAVFAGETLGKSAIAGLAIAFFGVTLIFWNDLAAGNLGLISGALLIFSAGICWAAYVMISRPLIREYGTLSISAWVSILAAPILWLMVDGESLSAWQSMDTNLWFALLYMSFLSNFVAGMCWNYGSARLPASVSGAFIYLVPVIAVAAGATLRHEIIDPEMIAGGALVLIGVALAQKPARKAKAS